MKIAIASDLHLEFADIDFVNPGADVLILAGDICVLKYLDASGDMGNRFRAFFKRCVDRFPHVIYILGNHESYGYRIDKSIDRAKEISGVKFLNNDTVTIDGVRFWGATLWTDFNNDPIAQLAARGVMNDYRIIRTDGGLRSLYPYDTIAIHNESINSLKQSKPDVVISHHLPSWQSVPQRYKADIVSHAYASNLDELIADLQPRLWFHGHTHDACDYKIKDTRVICNPRGYLGHDLAAKSWQLKVVDGS